MIFKKNQPAKPKRMRENSKTLWGMRWNFSRFFQIIDLLQWPNIESLFILFFFDAVNCSYIGNKTRVLLACTPSPLPSDPPPPKCGEIKKFWKKICWGGWGILFLKGGGKFFQREARESVKNSRIWEGGCKNVYDCGGIFVAKVAQYSIACHGVPFLTSSFLWAGYLGGYWKCLGNSHLWVLIGKE